MTTVAVSSRAPLLFVRCSLCLCVSIQLARADSVPLVKASQELVDGRHAVFLMYPSRDELRQSATHRLVVQDKGGAEEVVWETRSSERPVGMAFVDLDNDGVQLVAIRLDGEDLTFGLSNALGIDLIRVQKQGGKWTQIARGRAFTSKDRFTSVDIVGQGITLASMPDGNYSTWLDVDGKVRRYKEVRNGGVPDGRVPDRLAMGWLAWVSSEGADRILIHTTATSSPPNYEAVLRPARLAKTEALVWINTDGTTRRFERLADPPQPISVELRPNPK